MRIQEWLTTILECLKNSKDIRSCLEYLVKTQCYLKLKTRYIKAEIHKAWCQIKSRIKSQKIDPYLRMSKDTTMRKKKGREMFERSHGENEQPQVLMNNI